MSKKTEKNKEKGEDFVGQILERGFSIPLHLKDRQILYMLSINSRFSYSYIAKCIGISREAVHYRINALTKKGIFHGNMCLIDPIRYGFRKHIIYLKLKNFNSEEGIIKHLMGIREVVRINTCSGVWDLKLNICTKTLEEFNNFFFGLLNEIKPPVVDYLILEQLSEHYMGLGFLVEDKIPDMRGGRRINKTAFHDVLISPNPKEQIVGLDEVDVKLLKQLALNARIPINELALNIGVSQNNVEKRFRRLIDEGVIKGMFPMMSLGNQLEWYDVLLRMDNTSPNKLELYTNEHHFITWYTRLVGKYNYRLCLFVKNSSHFHEIMSELRNVFGDEILLFDSVMIHNQYKSIERVD